MVVKVSKPEINVREKLSELDGKVGTDSIIDGAVTSDKIPWHAHDLAPHWENLRLTNGNDYSYDWFGSGTGKLQALNGNNGPACDARLHGAAKGDFMVQWTPGYLWGFSALIMTPAANYNNTTGVIIDSRPPGMPYIWIANNSSNNKTIIQYWNGYVFNGTLVDVTGVNNGRFQLYRKNGTIKVWRHSASTTIPDVFDQDMVIVGGNQSPFSIQIHSAQNIITGY